VCQGLSWLFDKGAVIFWSFKICEALTKYGI